MVTREQMFIKNMEGTLYWQDEPLIAFKIKNRRLESYQLLQKEHLPVEMDVWGISYYNFNEFFKRRVVEDGAMLLSDYLDALKLDHYDFEQIVKRNNGSNHLDFYWVKFPNGVGVQKFDDIWNMAEPTIVDEE